MKPLKKSKPRTSRASGPRSGWLEIEGSLFAEQVLIWKTRSGRFYGRVVSSGGADDAEEPASSEKAPEIVLSGEAYGCYWKDGKWWAATPEQIAAAKSAAAVPAPPAAPARDGGRGRVGRTRSGRCWHEGKWEEYPGDQLRCWGCGKVTDKAPSAPSAAPKKPKT